MDEPLEPPEPEQEQKNLVLTLAKGAGISLGGRLFGRALLLVGQAILARALGLNDYGLYSIGWSVLQISLFATPLGLPQGIIYFGTNSIKDNETRFRGILQQTLSSAVGLGAISGVILFLLSPLLADLFNKPGLLEVLQGTAIALALSVIIKVAAAATRISRQMQYSALAEDLLPSLFLALGALIFTVLWKGGIFGSVTGLVLAQLLSVAFAFGFVLRLYPAILKPVPWQKGFLREIAAFSLPVSVAGLLAVLIQWVTRLILGYLRPEAEVGVYQAASQMASLPAIVLASTGAIFIPMISHLASAGQMKQLNEMYKIATKWSLYLGLPLFLVMIVFPAASLGLVFGRDYEAGASVLVIMSLGQLVNLVTGSVGPLHVMLGYRKQLVVILGVSLAATIILNVWWIPLWGVTGAAVGNTIGLAGSNLISLAYIKMKTGLWPYDRRYWKGLAAALATLLPLAALSVLHLAGFWPLAIAAVAACSLFPFLLWRLGFDEEDQQFLSAVRKRIGI